MKKYTLPPLLSMSLPVLFSVLLPAVLVGCVSTPDGFVRLDEHEANQAVIYRYDPEKVNKAAMDADALSYCKENGFDNATQIPPLASTVPTLKRMAYTCSYAVKKR
ncbi:MAG: hypothetical protein L0I86_12795 [Enterobacterales bacterium]|nr:hypothetical protein [Enterobacterales bacterium]